MRRAQLSGLLVLLMTACGGGEPDSLDSLVAALGDPAREAAAQMRLKRAGASAIAPLVAALDDRELFGPALRALAWLGKDEPRLLSEALRRATGRPRRMLARALARVGKKGVYELVTLLGDADPGLRDAAARGFALFDAAMVPTAIDALGSAAPEVVERAVVAMRGLRPQMQQGIPEMMLLLAHDDPRARMGSYAILGLVGSQAVPHSLRALGASDAELRAAGVQGSLARFRQRLVGILGMIGPEAKAAEAILDGLTESSDEPLRAKARWALTELRGG